MLHLLQFVAVTSLQGALSISDLPAFLDGLPETLSLAAGVLMFYQHLMVLALSFLSVAVGVRATSFTRFVKKICNSCISK